jgi:DNA polymerase-3 subunit epsilon
MRQIVLDTETTGLDTASGHRIIEIGGVEVINRKFTGRTFHQYINPMREVDQGALEVHGITNEFLDDKPTFDLIVDAFIKFAEGAELVIHNAPFDIGFLDYEFGLLGRGLGKVTKYCSVLDTLQLARKKHPGQKNTLDALCKRYMIDNSQRELHGALLDAEILADVYLAMTGGQTRLELSSDQASSKGAANGDVNVDSSFGARQPFVLRAQADELSAHEAKLDAIDKASGGSVWRGVADVEH